MSQTYQHNTTGTPAFSWLNARLVGILSFRGKKPAKSSSLFLRCMRRRRGRGARLCRLVFRMVWSHWWSQWVVCFRVRWTKLGIENIWGWFRASSVQIERTCSIHSVWMMVCEYHAIYRRFFLDRSLNLLSPVLTRKIERIGMRLQSFQLFTKKKYGFLTFCQLFSCCRQLLFLMRREYISDLIHISLLIFSGCRVEHSLAIRRVQFI